MTAGPPFHMTGGASWRFIENLPLGQFYKINVDLATPFNVMGGLQDNSMWHGPSSVWHNGGVRFSDWKEVGSGDGFATLAVPGNPRYVYSTREAGYIVRSDLQTGERHTIGPAHPEGIDLRYNWNPGMAIDPHDGSLYLGGGWDSLELSGLRKRRSSFWRKSSNRKVSGDSGGFEFLEFFLPYKGFFEFRDKAVFRALGFQP